MKRIARVARGAAGALWCTAFVTAAEPTTPDLGQLQPLPLGSYEPLFQPLKTDRAAMSPDGKYVAYSYRDGATLSLVVVERADPSRLVLRSELLSDAEATAFLGETRENTTAAIRWMKWVTPQHLVVETNKNFPYSAMSPDRTTEWKNITGEIAVIDMERRAARVLVTPKDVAKSQPPPPKPRERRITTPDMPTTPSPGPERDQTFRNSDLTAAEEEEMLTTEWKPYEPRIIDLAADDPEVVLVRASSGPDYDIYRLNVATGKLKPWYEDTLEEGMVWLADRQGRARIVMRTSSRTSFPHRFMLERRSGLFRWTELDKIVGRAGQGGFSVSPDTFFGQRMIPVGFDDDVDMLYYASNVGRDTYGIYALDLKSGKQLEQAFEHPHVDLISPLPNGKASPGTLVFDRYTRKLAGIKYEDSISTTLWLQKELQQLQANLEKSLAGRVVEIQEWDEKGRYFLLSVRGPADAGGFSVLDVGANRLVEFARRMPSESKELPRTAAFACESAPGVRISGLVTLPTRSRHPSIPVVVKFPKDAWMRVSSEYDSSVQALAQMGFAVVQVNARGAWGFGRSFRDAIKPGYASTQADDVLAAVEYLGTKLPLNVRRVALVAEGRGAYMAVRAAQLNPSRFKCIVALEPTFNLENWIADARWTSRDAGPAMTAALFGDTKNIKLASVLAEDAPPAPPTLVFSYPGPRGGPRTQAHIDAQVFVSRTRAAGGTAELETVDEDYLERLPKARSAVFRTIEGFLNERLYAYDVKMGETTEVPEKDAGTKRETKAPANR
jgi:dipeptidyl aminopeptidase/acylaminoacyl peptidase